MLRGLPSTSHIQKSTTCAATTTARKPRPKQRTSSLGREKQVQSLDIANLVKVKVKAEDFTSQNQHQNQRNLLNPLHQHSVTLDFSPTLSPIGSFELPPSYESACTSCVTLQHAAQSIDNSCGSNSSNSMQFANRFFPSCPSHTPVVSLGLDQAAGRRSVPSVGLASTSNSCAQSPDVLSPLSGVTGNSPQSSNCCTTDNYLQQQQLQHPFSLSASNSHLSTQTTSLPLSALALSHHSRDGLQQLSSVHERAVSTHYNTNLPSTLLTNHCSQPSVVGLFDNHSDNQTASIAGMFQLRDQVTCPVRPHMSTFLQPTSLSATGHKKVMTLPLPAAQYHCASQQQRHQWDDTSNTRWPLFPSPPLQSQQQLLQYSYPVQQSGSTTYAALLDSCTIPLLTPSPESTVSAEHWSSPLPDSPPEHQWLSDNISSSPATNNSQCRLLRY